MNKISKIMIVILSLCSLVACNSTRSIRNQPITQQLNSYLGQTPPVIIQQLNLQNIGINFSKQPILKENQLIYTFERIVATPIPTGIATPDQRGKMLQTQSATTSDTLKYKLPCNIIFDIQNGVAKSYQLKGKAC